MAQASKRVRDIRSRVVSSELYDIKTAIEKLKELSSVKFVETVELSCHIDTGSGKNKSGGGVVRSTVTLPHGTGRKLNVAVLTESAQEQEEVKLAGATKVGFQDLIEEIKQGRIDFDLLIAKPDSMHMVAPLGSILGPKGLMPNPKLGTVTDQPVNAIREALKGRVQYRIEKGGMINCLVGKLDFGLQALKENLEALLIAFSKEKPSSVLKTSFFKKVTLSSTMGPGIWVDISSLDLSSASF